MLSSYSRYIGSATMKRVNTSVVGVMMAATMSIATSAWRRYADMSDDEIIPMRPSMALTTGNSNTAPITRLMLSRVST